MEIQLTPDQQSFVRQAVESGRLQHEEAAIKEALSLWEERERRRLELLLAVDRAETSLSRSEGRIVSSPEQVDQLTNDIRTRGMARLKAESTHGA